MASGIKKSIFTRRHLRLIIRLREARLAAGLTQVQVSRRLRRPQSWVARLESGQRRVDVIELEMLAKLYRRTLSYFLRK